METILAATTRICEPRGMWLLEEGVVTRWTDGNLDQVFRNEWPDRLMTERQVLYDDEAAEGTPTPYCILEVQDPIILTHQTGHTADSEIQTMRVPVLFRIHAKSTATEDGKSICQRMAKRVAFIFDNPEKMDISPDTHITTIREADISVRQDDDEWMWLMQYDYLIDAVYCPKVGSS